ncbi:hypothetical protein J5754_01075 [bacterium]|nr:hypothetical protein [bacterium]
MMFRPEKMSLLQCVVLDQDMMKACNFLVRRKVMHLIDRSIFHPIGRETLSSELMGAQTSLEKAESSLRKVADWLGAEANRAMRPFEGELAPVEASKEISEGLAALLSDIEALEEKKEDFYDREAELKRISDALQSLELAGVSASELRGLKYFECVTGTMPLRFVPELKKALKNTLSVSEIRKLGSKDVSVIVLMIKEDADTVRSVLKSVFFNEVEIPEKYSVETVEAMDEIELELWMIREEEALLKKEELSLRSKARKLYARWKVMLGAHLRVLEAMKLFGKTASTTYISGWVPKKVAERIAEELSALLEGRLIYDISCPEDAEGEASSVVRSGAATVPTKFDHPSFLKPFEPLVTTYGYPEYNGIDPTLFVAITFLVLFGMMFGDVGQGLIFVLLGAFLAFNKKLAPLSDTGKLFMCVGVSAIVFGFMYGSVFGNEELIPALWLHPAEDSIKLIASAIFVGTLVLTLGILLNVWQAIMRKNWREAIFGQWGLLSSVFYWTAIALFYYMVVRKGTLSIGLAVAMLIVPVAAVLLGDIVWGLVLKRKAIKEALLAAKEEETEDEGLAEQLFKPVEIILSLMTNTISFMRVGAFGMNHAVMMSVVYILADVGGGWSGPGASGSSKVSYIVSIIVGNIFVMLLEGLIVFIQCLRLEYYEFFSKFFGGSGVKYDPLRVDDV